MEQRKQKQLRAMVVVVLCLIFLVAVSNILSTAKQTGKVSGSMDGQTDTVQNEMSGIETLYEEADMSEATAKSAGTASRLWEWLSGQCGSCMMPYFSFTRQTQVADSMADELFMSVQKESPFFYYMSIQEETEKMTESAYTYEMILALEGADEDNHTMYEEPDSLAAVEAENQLARDGMQGGSAETENQVAGSESVTVAMEGTDAVNMSENAAAQGDEEGGIVDGVPTASGGVVALRTAPVFEYDFSNYQDLDSLVKGFYIVDPTTSVTAQRLNLDSLLHTDVTIHGDSSNPQILIYHTHSQEGYIDSVPGDEATGVVGAGAYLAALLSEQYGYNVIHHTGQYDVEVRDQAYSVAAPAIEQILAQYPSIEVVIDLHRDEVREEVQLVTDIDGRTCAKFMFFNGLSYSNTLGDIGYLANPHIQENLAFSFQAQVVANEYYPGITRGIYLRAYRYNMHFVGKNMLIELGAQTNTCEEVWNTVPIIAQVLDKVFRGEE